MAVARDVVGGHLELVVANARRARDIQLESHDCRAAIRKYEAKSRHNVGRPRVRRIPPPRSSPLPSRAAAKEPQVAISVEATLTPEGPAQRRFVDSVQAGVDEGDGDVQQQGHDNNAGLGHAKDAVVGEIGVRQGRVGELGPCEARGAEPSSLAEQEGRNLDGRRGDDERTRRDARNGHGPPECETQHVKISRPEVAVYGQLSWIESRSRWQPSLTRAMMLHPGQSIAEFRRVWIGIVWSVAMRYSHPRLPYSKTIWRRLCHCYKV